MDDNTAFERMIAHATELAVGPPRSVDVSAIVGATTSPASSSPWPVIAQRLRATSPSPTWRFQSIFSATKFVVAGAIVALFGGFLLTAQPLDQQGPSVPAATTPEAGTFSSAGSLAKPRSDHTATLLSDPRLEGEVTTKFSVDFYSGEFADLNIGSSAFSIENDEGAWRERVQLGGGFPWGSESAQGFSVLDGEGAYEGLLAVLEVGDGEGGIRGFIFDGEFPPPPDNASTR